MLITRIVEFSVLAVERGFPGMSEFIMKKLEDLFEDQDHVCKLIEVEYGDSSSDLSEVGYECEICKRLVDPQSVRDIFE